jgi:hypothetical protein
VRRPRLSGERREAQRDRVPEHLRRAGVASGGDSSSATPAGERSIRSTACRERFVSARVS